MISQEAYDALLKRVAELEANLGRVAVSHKAVLENYLPQVAEGVANLTGQLSASQQERDAKMTQMFQQILGFVEAFDKRIEMLETVAFDE